LRDALAILAARPEFEKAIKVCLAESDYLDAVRATAALSKVSHDGELELVAGVHAAWGTALKKANDPTASEKLKAAATAYMSLAVAVPMRATEYQRKALPLYRLTGDSNTALEVINKLAARPDLDPNALAALHLEKAELLPPTDFAGVKNALEHAMESPGSTAMTARLKLALLHVNRGQDLMVNVPGSLNPDAVKKEAEQIGQFGRDLLRQVAESANVPPESRAVHEQALFELGRLCLRDTKFTDAEARFKKQLSLYPNGPYAGYGRLWLVCSLLQQARGKDNAKQLLEDALANLKPLTQSTDAYLRTYGEIWTANTLLELGDAAAVVPMTKELMSKYQGKPEELVAGKLLFYAYLKLPAPEPAEASRTLDRMEHAFAALPKTAYPNDPEYSHEKWKSELPRLREELRKFTP
jgi:tetratricopeptide (TPR) repeat protein